MAFWIADFGLRIKWAQLTVVCLMGLVGLSGCAMGPDFKPPVVETPKNYRFEKIPVETMINLKWWELFDDPVLYTLVNQALSNNKNLKIAAARVEQARAYLGFTRADQYPGFYIQAGAGTGNFSGGMRSETRNSNYYAGPTLSWELDFWGKFRRATESARAQLMASEYGLRTVQIGLISAVVGSYYLLLDFHQRVKISKDTLESREESLNIIQKRFDRGIIPELDVNQAQIQKEIAAAAIPQYERSVAQTEYAISIMLGKLPEPIKTGKELNLETVPPKVPMGLPVHPSGTAAGHCAGPVSVGIADRQHRGGRGHAFSSHFIERYAGACQQRAFGHCLPGRRLVGQWGSVRTYF